VSVSKYQIKTLLLSLTGKKFEKALKINKKERIQRNKKMIIWVYSILSK